MKKLLLISTAVLGLTVAHVPTNAQSPNWLWAKKANAPTDGVGNGICTDAFGNVYVTGIFTSTITFGSITLSTSSGMDIYVVKYDSAGNVLWAKKSITTSCNDAQAYSISTDASGNSYVVGFFGCTIKFGNYTLNTSGGVDFFIVKYDSAGNVLWAKSATGSIFENDEPFSISTDASGNSYVTGISESTSITFGNYTLTNPGIFVVKYDASGNVVWAKNGVGTVYSNGNSIRADVYGNVYVTGRFYGTITLGSYTLTSTDWDVLIAKYDTAGNVMWAKKQGGNAYDVGNGINTDLNGNIYVTGSFSSDTVSFGSFILTNDATDSTSDIFVAKYDTGGNIIWAKSAGGSLDDFSNSISADANGNNFITGYFHSDTLSFGSNTIIEPTNDTIYYNFFVVKYDSSGNAQWAYSNGNLNIGTSICTDANGYTYLTGFLGDSIIFGNTILTNTNGIDMFVTKFNDSISGSCSALFNLYPDTIPQYYLLVNMASGIAPLTYSWNWGDNSPIDTVANPSHTYTSAGLYTICLSITDSVGCTNTYCYPFYLQKTGNTMIYVNVIPNGTGINEINNQTILTSIFPNPFSTQTTLQTENPLHNATLTVDNCFGQTVAQIKNISGQTIVFSRDNLASGLYFVRLTEENKTIAVDKLVIADR